MDGPAPVMDYNEWLHSQPEEVQQEILGIGKWRLWRSGQLAMSDLVNGAGQPLTLEQLKRKFG